MVRDVLVLKLITTACLAGVLSSPGVAIAQSAAISVPALPLEEAIRAIASQSGRTILADPDAVRDAISRPVTGAASAEEAVQTAIDGLPLMVEEHDGTLMVVGVITVTARRDEAETSLLVKEASTSSRTGLSLREQPRNTQVISSRLMEQQQATTVFEALRNAGGVSVNTATVQGGTAYSVRGFGAGGIVNGLPAASNNGTNAGVTQPVANIERIEVLKGPDALLAGQDNLGGTINFVTKKPFDGELLKATAETGSFGQARGTLDANRALNEAGTLSGRVIAVAATADRNFGGYRGNEDYLFAPSLRYKKGGTDLLVGIAAADQIFGASPYTFLDAPGGTIVDRPIDQPVIGPEQGFRIGSTRYYGDFRHQATDWLTLVLRAQHEDQKVDIEMYSPFGLVPIAPGTAFVFTSRSQQRGNADAVDGFARIELDTGPVGHSLVIGATHTWNKVTAFSASDASGGLVNLIDPVDVPPMPGGVDTRDYILDGTQFGQYAQYVLSAWKMKLIAGARRNKISSTIFFEEGSRFNETQQSTATTPNFGAILDVTDNFSIFASLVYGYSATFALDAQQQRLPDIETRNLEGGIKLDLFDDRATLNLSYFELRQSNLIQPDPENPAFGIAVPGQLGKGVDFNASGTILPGLVAQGSFTRTEYSYLTPPAFGGPLVTAQPRDQYSAYLSYTRDLSQTASIGAGGGIFGRSSAALDGYGDVVVPAARQLDLNLFGRMGPLDINLGVRNVFDRVNYGVTRVASYIPYSEPRNWRLTVGYKFF